jgi:hypothetical protein
MRSPHPPSRGAPSEGSILLQQPMAPPAAAPRSDAERSAAMSSATTVMPTRDVSIGDTFLRVSGQGFACMVEQPN